MAVFVPYITLADYRSSIQKGQLNKQILDELNNGQERQFAESWAIGKVRGSLGHRYNIDFEIRPTLPFDIEKTYYAGDRCIISFDQWEQSKAYKQNDCVIKDGNGYLCLLENSDSSFDPDKWQGIGKENSIWSILFPYPIFSLNIEGAINSNVIGYYKTGDRVFWNNKIYEAIIDSKILPGDEVLQYGQYSSVPTVNVFPDDPAYGSRYWKFIEDYSVKGDLTTLPSGNDPDTAWKPTDSRDPVIVQAIIDLALWQLHSRISPNNIPDLRIDKMKMTFSWLRSVNDGDENIDMLRLQPEQGDSITWGSKIKQRNGY